ncbi:MAG: cysteine-rich CWC family protein [Nitrospira sp.]
MKGPVQKICGACGNPFECGGYQCWCGTVGITEQQMDWIAARFEDCLCPVCLRKVATGELGTQASQTIGPGAS